MLEKSFKLNFALGIGVAMLLPTFASAQLIESWENTLDGWTFNPSYNTQAGFTQGFSNTTGVTNGSYSLTVTSAGPSPNYGQMLEGPTDYYNTVALANATDLLLDVDTTPAAFGYFLQFDIEINNADTGFQSIDGYAYPSATIGSESTVTFPISPTISSELAASSNPTQIDISIGGGGGGGEMYLDNLRGNGPPVVLPEPMSLGAMGAGSVLLMLRRHRKSAAA
jgi:hypothetical protein